jgi:vacuolar protein sorting-associated protein 13A/C
VFEKREQDAKQKKLRDWEANKQAKLEAEAEAKGEKKAGFGAKMIEKVVDNIQVELTNVHIRYEDDVTDPKVIRQHSILPDKSTLSLLGLH